MMKNYEFSSVIGKKNYIESEFPEKGDKKIVEIISIYIRYLRSTLFFFFFFKALSFFSTEIH